MKLFCLGLLRAQTHFRELGYLASNYNYLSIRLALILSTTKASIHLSLETHHPSIHPSSRVRVWLTFGLATQHQQTTTTTTTRESLLLSSITERQDGSRAARIEEGRWSILVHSSAWLRLTEPPTVPRQEIVRPIERQPQGYRNPARLRCKCSPRSIRIPHRSIELALMYMILALGLSEHCPGRRGGGERWWWEGQVRHGGMLWRGWT